MPAEDFAAREEPDRGRLRYVGIRPGGACWSSAVVVSRWQPCVSDSESGVSPFDGRVFKHESRRCTLRHTRHFGGA